MKRLLLLLFLLTPLLAEDFNTKDFYERVSFQFRCGHFAANSKDVFKEGNCPFCQCSNCLVPDQETTFNVLNKPDDGTETLTLLKGNIKQWGLRAFKCKFCKKISWASLNDGADYFDAFEEN